MRAEYLIIPLLVSYIAVSCENKDTGTCYCESFCEFWRADSLSLSCRPVGGTQAIAILFEGYFVSENTEIDLRKKYDDFHYNQIDLPGTRVVLNNDFLSVHVTCDKDFCGIPSGAPIDSKITFVTVSPYKWLISGGTSTFNWQDQSNITGYFKLLPISSRWAKYKQLHPLEIKLSEMEKEDFNLWYRDYIYMNFDETPESGEYRMTTHFNRTRPLENSIIIDFN